MKERIIQFGTGNFLRGFADAFIDKLNKDGLFDGGVVIVSPTDSKNVDVINSQQGRYNLFLRGIENGETVNRRFGIDAVKRAVNPYRDFDGFIKLADSEAFRFIITNTTEAGITFDPGCNFTDKPAASFPAKLTQLLFRRYENGLDGFVILACELIDNNGAELKKCVLDYAKLWDLGDGFIEFVNTKNYFCNTLVDRIVTGYPKDEAAELIGEIGWNDRLLDTAEPYHFWAIEGDFESELPLRAAGLNVIWSDDISFYKKRKVRVLNGAHTSCVFVSLLCSIETVGQSLADVQLNEFLKENLFKYILPVLGESEENLEFAGAVLERFANPFIKHRWESIALNSISKFSVRVLPTMLEYKEKYGVYPRTMCLSLAALIKYYKQNEISDDKAKVEFIKRNGLNEILANSDLWGTDLSDMSKTVSEAYGFDDIRKAIAWSLS